MRIFLALLVACSRDSGAPKPSIENPAPSATMVAIPSSAVSTAQVSWADASEPAPPAADAGAAPLRAWMKREMGPAFGARKLPETAALLDQVAAHKLKGLPNWASIAKDGAAAARAGNYDAVKASCRTCHEQYKAKYIETSRALAFP
jgi:hypothetical protein